MASGSIGQIGNLAQTLASIGQGGGKPAFELRFSQMQNTLIGRLNDEIHKVNDAEGSRSEMLSLQRDGKKLADNMPIIEKFLFDTESNKNRFDTVLSQISTMVGLFTDDNNISAADITAFNTTRQETVDELNKLTQLSYVGFTDGNIIQRLKNEVAGLAALAPVEGVVDADGAPTTNVNRSIQTSLETLQTAATTAQDVSVNSISAIFDIRENMYSKMAGIQASVTELNSSVQLQKLAEVEALKEKYANILSSISLSYEVSNTMTQGLSDRLTQKSPAVGSVLNLFT